jgi:hypothetical protein
MTNVAYQYTGEEIAQGARRLAAREAWLAVLPEAARERALDDISAEIAEEADWAGPRFSTPYDDPELDDPGTSFLAWHAERADCQPCREALAEPEAGS